MTTPNVENYKEMEKRITLMQDPEWLQTISKLQNFNYDDTMDYSVIYRQGSQRKNRSFPFHKVHYIEETKSFIFTSYSTDFYTGDLTDEVSDKLTLKDIEIISIDERESFKASDFLF